MRLTIEVDDALGRNASAIYEALGLDTETAIKMFLKRTVLEQRLPLATNVPVATQEAAVPAELKKSSGSITRDMVEEVWRRFVYYLDRGGNISSVAADVHNTTGMNQGSAFIYLTILSNLINGQYNTQNMKFADLEYFVTQIRDYLDKESYLNTLESLKASIPYWEKDTFGQFASKVRSYVASLEKALDDEGKSRVPF